MSPIPRALVIFAATALSWSVLPWWSRSIMVACSAISAYDVVRSRRNP